MIPRRLRRRASIAILALAFATASLGSCHHGVASPASTPAAPRAPSGLPLSGAWGADRVWDDGLAEVATYAASRVIYGAPRPYRLVLITVAEDFDAQTLVKADPPYGARQILRVLKLNAVREIPTPNYDYRIMTSTFVERDDVARLVKLTSTGHEWCGNTWHSVRVRGGRADYAWDSYFDGEASGTRDLGLQPGDLVEDQLPITLRGLAFRDGLAFGARLLPSLAVTHAGPPRWLSARFRVRGPEPVDAPAGRRDAWRVDVDAGAVHSTWWFDAAGSHVLVRAESSDGQSLALDGVERRSYWSSGAPAPQGSP